MKFRCAHCNASAEKPAGQVNRARRAGAPLYCGRRCFGLARRKRIPKSVRRVMKAAYDADYRAKNRALLKAKKRAYFERTYDPAKARVERKKRAAAHAEYCRQPEYKAWKRNYDRHYRAKEFGPFAEAQMLVVDLNRTIKEQMNGHEIRQANGTCNKAQERRRGGAPSRDRHRYRPSHRVGVA